MSCCSRSWRWPPTVKLLPAPRAVVLLRPERIAVDEVPNRREVVRPEEAHLVRLGALAERVGHVARVVVVALPAEPFGGPEGEQVVVAVDHERRVVVRLPHRQVLP